VQDGHLPFSLLEYNVMQLYNENKTRCPADTDWPGFGSPRSAKKGSVFANRTVIHSVSLSPPIRRSRLFPSHRIYRLLTVSC
jgi:hypothetical protein